MIRVLKFILLFIAFPLYIKANTEKLPINRHFIIVVDQTINSSNNNLSALYKGLSCWLQGENPLQYIERNASVVPPSLNFDQQNDAISLFAFGMPGNGHKMNSEYGRIHSECWNGSKSEQYVFKDVTKSLIHKRERYINGERVTAYNGQHDQMSLPTFLRDCLRPLFNSQDPLHVMISNNSGITMSHFVYPLIMNFISKEETANEYYLILVSDFKSGQYSNNDQDDKNTLYSLISGKSHIMAYFERQIKSMRAPFVQAEYLHFQAGDLGARGVRLIHKDIVMKSQLYLNSSLELSQKRGNQFNLSEANITFDKDKATTIDSIGIMILEGKKLLSYRTIVRGDDEIAKLLTEKREYEIPAQTSMDLGQSSLGDITVKYIFFTMSHDSEGNSVLPVSLTSQQIIAKESITYIDQEFRRTMTIVLITLSIIIIIAIMYWLGRKKEVVVNISRFAQKYVSVTKDRGAVELPCWFYVKDNNLNRIKVSGSVECCRKMTIGGMTKLYVRLQETKPDGFSYYVNGKECNKFLYIPLKGNKFSFELDININPDIVDVHQLHACSVMMDFKVETSLCGMFKHTDIGISPEVYDFYFIEDLGRAWVGLDPGTSGSCVAIGNPSGALNDPSISLVEVSQGETMTKIIPSRIIFNKSLAGKTIDMLLPNIDYEYGIAADRNWRASSSMPRFQSIKKLLGYKKADEDKIDVCVSGSSLKFSGVDLAHLLMRGLDRDLMEYLNNMPVADRQRISENGECPQRAVVAIPNNYTLPKIEDMIESVARLGKFKEIRFIYEAEGVLFNYLRKTFGEKQSGTETIMVYDMGGATINLTVFRITYSYKNGSTYYNISTLGRIGYAVGGDNIDVALMEYIFTMVSKDEKKRHEYEKKNKTKILDLILGFKKNIINAQDYTNKMNYLIAEERFMKKISRHDINLEKPRINREIEDIQKYYTGLLGALCDKDGYITETSKILGDFGKIEEREIENNGNTFIENMLDKILHSSELQNYVYSKIEDAVGEILNYPEVKSINIDKLIFAGRSTMFPKIKDIVNTKVRSHSKHLNVLNIFSDEEIKTSVAYGACWYGIYNGLVTLDNSRLTSAYGFKQTTGTDSNLKILLNQNSVFGDDNMVHGSIDIESLFDGDGQTVSFYQIMGSGTGKELLSEKNRYKVNFLTGIPVTQLTQSIGIDVGRNNFATCSVTFDTGMTERRSDLDIQTRDITEENDWAYVFATTDEESVDQPATSGVSRSNQPTERKQTAERIAPLQSGQWYDNLDKNKKRRF